MEAASRDGSFKDASLRSFIERLSSAEPVPGGGSAAAVAGGLGAALVAMVAALSRNRPAYAEHEALLEEAEERSRRLAESLLDLADADAAAYAEYAAALKLPKVEPDEERARRVALAEAARRASEVPLRTIEACHEVATAAAALAGRSNRNAASDLLVAALLAEAAARAAAANVLTNLPAVDDPAFVDQATGRVDRLLHEIGRAAETTRETIARGERREPVTPASPAGPATPGAPANPGTPSTPAAGPRRT